MTRPKRHIRRKIGWARRDEEGNRYRVEAWFFAGNVLWERQDGRHSPRQPHQPDQEDWERLEEDVQHRIDRGLLETDDLRRVRQQREKSALKGS